MTRAAWGPPFVVSRLPTGQISAPAITIPAIAASATSSPISKQPEGQKIVRQLARHADVLIENFKLGGLKKYGLDYE